jgi:hypothetical protein
MSITRLQQARQMYATGQRVGRIAFQGGGASWAPSSPSNSPGHPSSSYNNPSNNISPSRVGNTNNFTEAAKGTLSDPRETEDFVGETMFGPTQKYTGGSSLFGGANKYGYTDQYVNPIKSNFGQLKPGYGGRLLGGIASMITGIPFVGGTIGNMYDKGKGIFSNKPRDMSEFNQYGLDGVMPEDFEDEKISLTSFTEDDPSNLDNMFKEAYNNYLIDAPIGNPLSFEEFSQLMLDRQESYENIVNVGDI